MDRTPNKSQHTKLTLEKKILPPLLPGLELATFRSRARRSNQQVIPAKRCAKGPFTPQPWPGPRSARLGSARARARAPARPGLARLGSGSGSARIGLGLGSGSARFGLGSSWAQAGAFTSSGPDLNQKVSRHYRCKRVISLLNFQNLSSVL